MKNLIIITGGAGFVGSNLIELLLKKTKFKIISIDNYSTGSKKNHLKSPNVTYIKGDTSKISILLNSQKKKFTLCFTLGNSQEYIKALKTLTSVTNQMQ